MTVMAFKTKSSREPILYGLGFEKNSPQRKEAERILMQGSDEEIQKLISTHLPAGSSIPILAPMQRAIDDHNRMYGSNLASVYESNPATAFMSGFTPASTSDLSSLQVRKNPLETSIGNQVAKQSAPATQRNSRSNAGNQSQNSFTQSVGQFFNNFRLNTELPGTETSSAMAAAGVPFRGGRDWNKQVDTIKERMHTQGLSLDQAVRQQYGGAYNGPLRSVDPYSITPNVPTLDKLRAEYEASYMPEYSPPTGIPGDEPRRPAEPTPLMLDPAFNPNVNMGGTASGVAPTPTPTTESIPWPALEGMSFNNRMPAPSLDGLTLDMGNAGEFSNMTGPEVGAALSEYEQGAGQDNSFLKFWDDGKSFRDTLETGANVMGAIGAGMQAYTGFKQLGLAKKQFQFNKQLATQNFNNQANLVNLQLGDYQRQRLAAGTSNQGVDQFLKENSVKGI